MITIQNKRGKLALNDGITKESADKLLLELGEIYGKSAVENQLKIGEVVCSYDGAIDSLEVEINSPGGSVFDGMRIYNALRELANRGVAVSTIVSGVAASMGSVVLVAGGTRRVATGSRVMIHEASTAAQGNAQEMRRVADLLEGISNEIAGIYAERTGQDAEQIRELMKSETWMDEDKAIKLGFATEEFDKKPKSRMSILSKLFPGNDEVAKLEAAVSEIDALRKQLSEVEAAAKDNDSLKAQLDDALNTIVSLKAEAKSAGELAQLAASEVLATLGHPAPVSLVGDEESKVKTKYEQYRDLQKSKPSEATAFWDANEKEIIAGI